MRAYEKTSSPSEFLDRLHVGQEQYCRFLWSPAADGQQWQAIGNRKREVTNIVQFKGNAYAFVKSRREAQCSVDVFFSPNQFFEWRNSKQLALLHANWIEIDTRGHRILGDDDERRVLDEVLDQLMEARIPTPSAIVRSGSGGYRLYWIYDGAPAFRWRVKQWRAVAAALCDALKGGELWEVDHGASKDPARVLRLPGSIHRKSGRTVEAWTAASTDLYDFDEIARRVCKRGCTPPLLHQTKSHQTKSHQTKSHQTKSHQTKSHQTKSQVKGRHTIGQWWFKIYTYLTYDLRSQKRQVPEGKRDSYAFILFVALRHIKKEPEEALAAIKDLNDELIGLPEKELMSYLGTALRVQYKYRKATLKAYLAERLDLDPSFLETEEKKLSPEERYDRQAQAGRETARNRKKSTQLVLAIALKKLREARLKATQSAIAKEAGMSIRTVKRYWDDLVGPNALSLNIPPSKN